MSVTGDWGLYTDPVLLTGRHTGCPLPPLSLSLALSLTLSPAGILEKKWDAQVHGLLMDKTLFWDSMWVALKVKKRRKKKNAQIALDLYIAEGVKAIMIYQNTSAQKSCTFYPHVATCWVPISVDISPWPDSGTPLYPPFRLGATRLIHLHSSKRERGTTRGTNTTWKEIGLRKSNSALDVIWQKLYCTFCQKWWQSGSAVKCSKHI